MLAAELLRYQKGKKYIQVARFQPVFDRAISGAHYCSRVADRAAFEIEAMHGSFFSSSLSGVQDTNFGHGCPPSAGDCDIPPNGSKVSSEAGAIQSKHVRPGFPGRFKLRRIDWKLTLRHLSAFGQSTHPAQP